MKAKANMDALKTAVLVLGSQKALADACDVKFGTVSAWFARGNFDSCYAPLIELATDLKGQKVTVEELHPGVRWDIVRGKCPRCGYPQ